MRSIKKLTNVFITLILSIILVMSNLFINVHAAENSQIYYLALGDSITAATPGYVEIVANNIGADATINGGCSGVTSYDLYNYIKTNEGARSVIKQANVITLQIG